MLKLRMSERGDTIVEVLIVLAILGLALGMSYVTANRSLLGARQAHEHTEALELIQSQIEQLRTLPDTQTDIYYPDYTTSHPNGFCLANSTTVNLNGSYLNISGSNYPNQCQNGFYHASIRNINSDNTFQVTVIWEDVRGHGIDTVSLRYKLK
jgi:prepilin-type N-terminal cleavage/methylation domain-containing protein